MRSLFALTPLVVLALALSACSPGSQVTPPAQTTTLTPQSTTGSTTLSAQQAAPQSEGDVYNDGKHILYPPVGMQRPAGGKTTSVNLLYNGGSVMNSPAIYVVYWQWATSTDPSVSDPSGEETLLDNFLAGVGSSSWLNTVTQYYSNPGAIAIANPSGQLGNTWDDNTNAIPAHPSDSQIAAEAVRAAVHFFGNNVIFGNNVAVVVATPHGNSTRGFGVQWCAYHSSTSTTHGSLGYTNLPYITDAGASCGANFNGLGPYAGISIVGGHEYAESITDIFPSSGWLDKNGSEIGDKCAWSSASSNITLSTGSFAVQPLWSNSAGGCVMSS